MKLALILAAAPALLSTVNAHGGMIEPKPRAITTMKLAIDSTFGHPINMRKDYTNGKGGDCIGFTPDTNLQPLAVGESKIKMRANDGANHVGMCTVYLISPTDNNKKVKVGEMNDCMRSLHPGPGNKGDQPIPGEMKLNVPSSGLPCDANGHCVLQFNWEAAHITPHEFYNNCADVKVSGGGSGPVAPTDAPAPSTKAPTPAATTTAPAPAGTTKAPAPTSGAPAPTSGAPAPTSGAPAPSSKAPAPGPAPGPGGKCKYKYIGPHPDVASHTQWCEWNCEGGFCPEDLCQADGDCDGGDDDDDNDGPVGPVAPTSAPSKPTGVPSVKPTAPPSSKPTGKPVNPPNGDDDDCEYPIPGGDDDDCEYPIPGGDDDCEYPIPDDKPTTKPVGPVAPTTKPVGPVAPTTKPVAPTDKPVGPVAPTTKPVAPTDKPVGPVAPTTKPVGPVAPTTKPVGPVAPTTKPVGPVAPTTKPVGPVAPTSKPTGKPGDDDCEFPIPGDDDCEFPIPGGDDDCEFPIPDDDCELSVAEPVEEEAPVLSVSEDDDAPGVVEAPEFDF